MFHYSRIVEAMSHTRRIRERVFSDPHLYRKEYSWTIYEPAVLLTDVVVVSYLTTLGSQRTLRFTQLTFTVWAERSGDRIPIRTTSSAPVRTRPGTQPVSDTMRTESFPGVKQPVRGVNRPPPSNAEIKGRTEL